MFGTLGGPELFLIFVVALIVFGPRKLPEIGKSLGRMMGEFRRASNEFKSTIESEVEWEKIRESMRIEAPKVGPAKAKTAAAAAGGAAADGGDASDEADEAPDATDSPPEEPTPSSDSDSGSVPTEDVVPEAVSRQPPAPAEEQK